jgi:hypothetical protein
MGIPLIAPTPSIGYYGSGTASRGNLNLLKTPSSRSRRVLFRSRSSRSFEEALKSPKPEMMDVPSYYGSATSFRGNLDILKTSSSRSRRVLFRSRRSSSFEEATTCPKPEMIDVPPAPNLTPSFGYFGRGTSFRGLNVPYLQKTAFIQSSRGLSKSMSCRSFERTIPNPEPESMDVPATQNQTPSNLSPENAASSQSPRRLFRSKSCRSLVQTPTARKSISLKQMSRFCSLRCITEKAFEPVNVKPIKPIELPRYHSDSRRHLSHKRHVHFSFGSDDDGNDVYVQVETIPFKLDLAEYKSNLAWKTDEIKEFQQECRDMADFHKTNEDYVACILHLFACKKPAPSTGAHDGDDNVAQTPSVLQDTAAIRMLSKSPARGLEARVAPILRAHRQWGVTVILATQAKLNKCKVTDREKREKMLRARSLQTSKRSRVFALMLAQGDASEALMAGRR